MAQAVYLFLKANGEDVKGESTVTSMGREDSIECLAYEFGVRAAREAGSGLATGRRKYEPIRIRKRIDKATPLIARALTQNEVVEGTFKFYRPSWVGDGTEEQFFTVEIQQGRVSSIQRLSPDSMDPAASARPMEEMVELLFGEITWTHEDGGISHMDSWSGE